MRNNILALGIPTFKRPIFAMRAIENALNLNIYDQIIISSNSNEIELNNYINSKNNSSLVFHQQTSNVGMALNFNKIISLCRCKYIHIISDEDYLIKDGVSRLYKYLYNLTEDRSVIFVSVHDEADNLYRDTSWQNNHDISNFCCDSGHIGSSVFRVNHWTEDAKKLMLSYCIEKGSAYPTAAAPLISYNYGGGSAQYFPYPILKMGKKSNISEMGGHSIYGYKGRFEQYIAMINLVCKLNLKNNLKIHKHLMEFFINHALRGALIKYKESPMPILKYIIKNYELSSSHFVHIFAALSFTIFFIFKSYVINKLRRFNFL